MLGVLAGFLPIAAIKQTLFDTLTCFGFAYLCYTIAITVWNVPFPLLIVGVCLSLMVIYVVGISGGKSRVIRNVGGNSASGNTHCLGISPRW